jgi:replicative DNA helicase
MQDVEKLTIQYLLYSPDCIRELVTSGIDLSYFSNEVNKTFMRIIFEYFRDHSKMVATTALALKLEQLKVQQQIIQEYLNPNFEELSDLDVDFLIIELQNKKKQTIMTGGIQNVVFNLNNGDVREAETEVQKVMRELIKTDTNKKLVTDMNVDIDIILDTLAIPKEEKILETGYIEFDQATGGFQPGWLVLLSALPKVGKTQSLVNLGCGLARRGVNVLVFTLEVPRDQYINLLLSCFGNIDVTHIRKRTLDAYENAVLNKLRVDMRDTYGRMTIVDTLGGCNSDYINAQIEEQQIRNGIKYDVVIVDHATMMKANAPTGKDHFDQGSIAEDLRSIARKRNLTLIAAVQRRNIAQKKRKQSGEEDQKPEDAGGEEIGRSLIWYQTADIVIMIQNEKPDDQNAVSTLTYKIINRYGPSSTFDLIKDFSKTSLMSVEGNLHMKGIWDDGKLG